MEGLAYSTDVFANVSDGDIFNASSNTDAYTNKDYLVIDHIYLEDMTLSSIQLIVDQQVTTFGELYTNSDWEIRRISPLMTVVKKNVPGEFNIKLQTTGEMSAPIGEGVIGSTFVIG